MTLHCLADSMDLRPSVSPHRTYMFTLLFPVLSVLPFESSPPDLLDDVQFLLGHKTLRRSRCTSQTTFCHLEDFSLEVRREFLKIVEIDRFIEICQAERDKNCRAQVGAFTWKKFFWVPVDSVAS